MSLRNLNIITADLTHFCKWFIFKNGRIYVTYEKKSDSSTQPTGHFVRIKNAQIQHLEHCFKLGIVHV